MTPEAKFVANLQTLLPILLGDPEQVDGRGVCVPRQGHDHLRLEDPSSTGLYTRRHDTFGGAGLICSNFSA